MSALHSLNEELSYQGQRALLVAARKKGLGVTNTDVWSVVEKDNRKHMSLAVQPSRGSFAA